MINVNVFQYNREIELVCLDATNTSSATAYLGNMPMYDGHHKLHKGIDNTLRFRIRDTDRKPIDLTTKTLIFKMYDRQSRENVLFMYPNIENATKGLASLVIPTADSIMLPEGFYTFAMYTVEDGVEQIIYTDTYDNAKGVMEVVDDVYPEFEDSQESSIFFYDSIKHISTVFDGAGNTIKSKSLHTIAIYYEGFTGTVTIQGDLSIQPSSSDSDWFDLTPRLLYDSSITVNNETGVQAFVVQANVNWLRVVYTNTTGSISKILVRN
jgi:hypothetical protein